MPLAGVLTATVPVSALSGIMMGLHAKNPVVLAPGKGINAFFTRGVVLGMGVSAEPRFYEFRRLVPPQAGSQFDCDKRVCGYSRAA